MAADEEYMRRALELAKQGNTAPNPMVGAVIVKDGRIIGEGFHSKAGKDHGEIATIKNCTEDVRGATLYITLEPCNHQGLTPPCVDTLIEKGFRKIVVAVKDPNPKMNGKSIQKLRDQGIEVVEGILEREAAELNKVFFKNITTNLPYVYLKAAITLDGKIATKTGDSRWISSDESRRKVHELRAQVSAILVGKNTVLKDNPFLTARTEITKYPLRIVLAETNDLPCDLHVFNEEGETLVMNSNVEDVLRTLGEKGISSVLVEGGSTIFSRFIEKKLVDEFWFFIAPRILGDTTAVPFMHDQNVLTLAERTQLQFTGIERVGDDVWIRARHT